MWRKRQIQNLQHRKHCCNNECINAKDCELKARERWSNRPPLFLEILLNPVFAFGLGFACGVMFGVL
jgi:hypothetical protein